MFTKVTSLAGAGIIAKTANQSGYAEDGKLEYNHLLSWMYLSSWPHEADTPSTSVACQFTSTDDNDDDVPTSARFVTGSGTTTPSCNHRKLVCYTANETSHFTSSTFLRTRTVLAIYKTPF